LSGGGSWRDSQAGLCIDELEQRTKNTTYQHPQHQQPAAAAAADFNFCLTAGS